jgi:hypothetical protein
MRKFRTDKHSEGGLKDVHVLVRITSVFNIPRFDIFVDPWRLFASDKLALHGDWALTASITEAGYSSASGTQLTPNQPRVSESQLPPPQRPTHFPVSQAIGRYGMQSGAGASRMNYPYCTEAADMTSFSSVSMNQEFQNQWRTQHPYSVSRTGPQPGSMGYPPPYLPSRAEQPLQQPSVVDQRWNPRVHQIEPVSGQPSHKSWENGLDCSATQGGWSVGVPGLAAHPRPSAGPYERPEQKSTFNPTAPPFTSMLQSKISQNNQFQTTNSLTKPLTITIPSSATSKYSSKQLNGNYKQLNGKDIRLLILYPGDNDATLRGVLSQVPLRLAGAFYALSYVWGKAELSHSLWMPEGTIISLGHYMGL